MDPVLIARINQLSKMAREAGLTPEEKQEQARLRDEYRKSFRRNFISTMDSVVIVDAEGNRRKLEKPN